MTQNAQEKTKNKQKKTRSVASHRNDGNYWICLTTLMEMNVCTHI